MLFALRRFLVFSTASLRPVQSPLFAWLTGLFLLLNATFAQAGASTLQPNPDGTVTDSSTGLTWMRCSMSQTWNGSTCTNPSSDYYFVADQASAYTFDQANAFTGTVTFAGHSDWRMPNIRELQTIVVRRTADPPLGNSAEFPNTPSTNFWTSSPSANDSYFGWVVSFYDGYSNNSGSRQYAKNAVRLVRGGQSSALLSLSRPDTDYADQGNGTVTHIPTGLTWQRCAVGQVWTGSTCSGTAVTSALEAALEAAKLLTGFAGKTDWRLPTVEELVSLVDYSKTGSPALNTTLFPNAPSSSFWSGSDFWAYVGKSYALYYTHCAWYVSFDFGEASYSGYDSAKYSVRLVRGGQSFGPWALTVSKSGAGTGILISAPSGISCGATCSASFDSNISVTLTAVPAPGSTFTGWSGVCSGTGTCVVNMNAAQSVTAAFDGGSSLNFVTGWNLAGNSVQAPISVATSFNDATKITTIWKWVNSNSTPGITYPTWAFYTPALSDGGQAYATSKGYDFLTTINMGEGFWVHATTDFTAQVPAGAAVTSASFQNMSPGWHLIATGETKTPSQFNTDMSTTPAAAGVVPQNITSLWAWDNMLSKWYYYAPSFEALGATALSDYIASHGYLEFSSAHKTLGPGVGVWVNKL